MNKRTRAEDFIAKATVFHGNRYGYAQTVFVNWKTPVVIECPIHGPFRQWPETHLRGAGCKRCKAAKAMEAKSKEAARAFVGRAREMHGDKYDYSKAEYKASNEKVVIICPTHEDFLQTPANHMYGRGCPACARQHIAAKLAAKPLAAQTSQAPEVLTQAFIKKAWAIHGDKYRYEGVRFVNGRTPVEIVCPEHGPFFQLPSPHLAGAGCKSCADKARGIEKNRKAAAEFRNRARAVHGNKYDYLQTTYARSSQKVEIVCLKHGPFFIRPDHFLSGVGCPKCGVESMAAKQATGLAEFVRQSRETHGTKLRLRTSGIRLCPQAPDNHLPHSRPVSAETPETHLRPRMSILCEPRHESCQVHFAGAGDSRGKI